MTDKQEYQRNYQRNYRLANQATISRKRKLRYQQDRLFRTGCKFRNSIRGYLEVNSDRYNDLIGCTPNELKQHIQDQFKQGMHWNNHTNRGKGWVLDHRITLTQAKTVKQMRALCHYSNLQPLWWFENLSKGFKSADCIYN